MQQHNGTDKTLRVTCGPDYIVLQFGSATYPLDPAVSRELALQLCHWLLDQAVRGGRRSPLHLPPTT